MLEVQMVNGDFEHAEHRALEFVPAAEALSRALASPDDPVALRRAALAGWPDERASVLALLGAGLEHPGASVRSVVGELIVFLRIPGLHDVLRSAAAKEADPGLSRALGWAAEQCSTY